MATAAATKNGATKMNSSTRLKRLRELVGQAKENNYERVSHAAALLNDSDFVTDRYGGDEGRARDEIQSAYFPDIGGLLSIGRLLEIFAYFPKRSEWEARNDDLRWLWLEVEKKKKAEREALADAEAKAQGKKPVRNRATLKETEELSQSLHVARESARSLSEELDDAKKRIHELEIENAELRGRVKALEQQIARMQGAEAA